MELEVSADHERLEQRGVFPRAAWMSQKGWETGVAASQRTSSVWRDILPVVSVFAVYFSILCAMFLAMRWFSLVG